MRFSLIAVLAMSVVAPARADWFNTNNLMDACRANSGSESECVAYIAGVRDGVMAGVFSSITGEDLTCLQNLDPADVARKIAAGVGEGFNAGKRQHVPTFLTLFCEQ